eukprot:764488-Hanusia_phi.AAC.3
MRRRGSAGQKEHDDVPTAAELDIMAYKGERPDHLRVEQQVEGGKESGGSREGRGGKRGERRGKQREEKKERDEESNAKELSRRADAVQEGVEGAYAGSEEEVRGEEGVGEERALTGMGGSILAGGVVSNNAVGFSKMCEVRRRGGGDGRD